MKPYWSEGAAVHLGDALAVLCSLPDASVHAAAAAPLAGTPDQPGTARRR